MEANQHDFISIETPRIRKFYDYHSKKEIETPLPQMNNFLQLLTSPVDGQPLLKLQYMTMRHQDLIANQLENSLSALKTKRLSDLGYFGQFENSSRRPETSHKSEIEELLFGGEHTGKKLNFPQEAANENIRRDNKENKKPQLNLNSSPNGERCPLRDITAQVNNKSNQNLTAQMSEEDFEDGGRDAKNLEIRKRKRKSNQQLKILQSEFERDGFWGKDKILHVARVTGLSESQVYKWCWDQKKKKETDVRPDDAKSIDIKSSYSQDKENISPLQDSGLNKNSKHIFKTKNSSNFGSLLGKSMEKYRLKKHQKLRFEATVPKRIDFSLE